MARNPDPPVSFWAMVGFVICAGLTICYFFNLDFGPTKEEKVDQINQEMRAKHKRWQREYDQQQAEHKAYRQIMGYE